MATAPGTPAPPPRTSWPAYGHGPPTEQGNDQSTKVQQQAPIGRPARTSGSALLPGTDVGMAADLRIEGGLLIADQG